MSRLRALAIAAVLMAPMPGLAQAAAPRAGENEVEPADCAFGDLSPMIVFHDARRGRARDYFVSEDAAIEMKSWRVRDRGHCAVPED
jgi:hypothetical protein